MSLWREGSLLVGIVLASVVIAKCWTVGAFQFRFKKQPPAVRVDPELLQQMRSELIHDAMKRKVVRPDFNRSFK